MAYTTHWIDETLRVQEAAARVDEDVPDWANVELDADATSSSSYGTKAVVEHLVQNRSKLDYGEFDRQLGVILENESSWIREERINALLMDDVDTVSVDYDQNRRGFVDIVNVLEEAKVAIPTRGFKAIAELDEDGYMRENLGPYGRRYAQAVVGDISRERVLSGRVPVPDDMGFDFSKGADLSPERAREITRGYDAEKMAERQADLRREVLRDLDGITGVIPEDGMELSSMRPALSRESVEEALGEEMPVRTSEEEAEADGFEGMSNQMTPESIEELLAEYARQSMPKPDFERDDVDPTF